MADFKVVALSEIHIGSGQILTKNIDFDYGFQQNENNERENIIGVFDINKIFRIVGKDNVDKLISFIEKKDNGSFVGFVNKYSTKTISLSQISKRVFCVYGENFLNYNFLKEQLINSDGFPFIPGSSLKGAIRTAILTHLVEQNKREVREIIENYQKDNLNKNKREVREIIENYQKENLNKKFKEIGTKIVNTLLSGTEGDETSKNIMRFLNVSDIEFQYETIGIIQEVANLFRSGWDIKNNNKIILEVIPEGSESEVFRININETLLNENIKKGRIKVNTEFLSNWENISSIINKHTQKIIEQEIDFWEKQNYSILNYNIEQYIEKLKGISENFTQLKENEAIIRVGGNTGWDSITGGWAREVFNESEWSNLYKQLNKGRNVEIFPKTRKIGSEGEIMGFLKIIKI